MSLETFKKISFFQTLPLMAAFYKKNNYSVIWKFHKYLYYTIEWQDQNVIFCSTGKHSSIINGNVLLAELPFFISELQEITV